MFCVGLAGCVSVRVVSVSCMRPWCCGLVGVGCLELAGCVMGGCLSGLGAVVLLGVLGVVYRFISKRERDAWLSGVVVIEGLISMFVWVVGNVLLSVLGCFVVFCCISLLLPWVRFSSGV